MTPLKGKRVLLGITSGIAAYKIPGLIRLLKKNGAQVKTLLSPNALEFVTVKTLETLTEQPVYVEPFERMTSTEHISLAKWADLFVIAPATANTISKFANGICDNLLTSVFCAYFGDTKDKKTVIIAPAMNSGMWNNCFVKENVQKLSQAGCTVLSPETGFLACNETGIGRLCEINKIFDAIENASNTHKENHILTGKKIIITAGGTKEAIDPVRYITNASSGKMGAALFDAAHTMGAEVEFITTFDTKRPHIRVNTADEMLEAVLKSFPKADCLIMAAAVADYKVKSYNKEKIQKTDSLTLELVKNTDILEKVCKLKTKNQTIVGFSLTTSDTIENAKAKIDKKCCDYIIANEAKTALGTDETEVWIIDRAHHVEKLAKNSKENIAKAILERIYDKN